MGSGPELLLGRAENELRLAIIVQRMSDEPALQLGLGMKEDTYYSAVISHAYYAIFYAAKAYLLRKGVRITPPEEHRKAYEAFSAMVAMGAVDAELLRAYQSALVKADTLLRIHQIERGKRGRFTYRTLPQANRGPAAESVTHGRLFLRHLSQLCGQAE